MPAQKGREWDAVVVIDKGLGNQQDKVRCLYCKSDFYGSATRIRKHIINAKGGGIGACKGSLPENFVAELRSFMEKAKVEAQREAEIRKKLEKNIQSGKYVQKRIPDNSTRALKLAADKSLAMFFYRFSLNFKQRYLCVFIVCLYQQLNSIVNVLNRTLTYERNQTYLTHFSRKINVRTNYGYICVIILSRNYFPEKSWKLVTDNFPEVSKQITVAHYILRTTLFHAHVLLLHIFQ